MKDYPIVPLSSLDGTSHQIGQSIIKVVETIERKVPSCVHSLEAELNALVYELYQLDAGEIKAVESFLRQ